ncbi:undecaprenyldiphospho-muramoylpentapeptide beta-N-acetylglucosaminyltransferase [Prolixibacteraceae bacterium JC049]|nr:undecaprenyldiphospho-muramoylpentapeptide beta-N-acetylglucosaminyltransferase [Prolixibacteraceae bacterium JC049]
MKKRFIISGGGTGGHIYPAISIANTLKELEPDCEILFVGAEGRMEMEKVPAAGYKIKGLPIMGLPRTITPKLFTFFVKWFKSRRLAKKIIEDFAPNAAVGVGGYASGPLLKMAGKLGVPTIIQEQNSYAGITNKLLAKDANKICVAYEKMERFFPKQKIVLTGNPIRKDVLKAVNLQEARDFFGIKTDKPVVAIVGGSLGARTINNAVLNSIEEIAKSDVEFIWQTGKFYYNEMVEKTKGKLPDNLHIFEFVTRMDFAFGLADMMVSRAGAGTISELCLVGMPTILVPSPNVAEDHQTKNAKALSDKGAAILIRDNEIGDQLVDTVNKIIHDKAELDKLKTEVKKLAKPNAAEDIARIVLEEAR